MSNETFDLPALAKYLSRDVRELEKLASSGRLPGRRVGNAWRFHRAEVNEWLEKELPTFSDQQLESMESGLADGEEKPDLLFTRLVQPTMVSVQLSGRTAPGVLKSLVDLANAEWQVYAPGELLDAVKAREELCSTAMPGGWAMPHPRRPMADALEDHLVAFGRTASQIPFGGPRGALTDVFFLLLCRDERTHLQTVARLARMVQRDRFIDRLREAEGVDDVLQVLRETEEEVVGD
ncbi:MAG: PTS sugar transporter subunit IIA [Planctomycetia bacterium]